MLFRALVEIDFCNTVRRSKDTTFFEKSDANCISDWIILWNYKVSPIKLQRKEKIYDSLISLLAADINKGGRKGLV